MRKILFLAVLLALFRLEVAQATTYWAAATGGNPLSCGTTGASDPGSGYTTFTVGLACLNPGDTLMLKGGIYPNSNGAITNSGTNFGAGAITIRNAPGETVRFSGNHPIDFYAYARQYIIIDGSDGNNTPCSIGNCTTRIIYDGTLGAGGVVTNLASYIRWKGVEIKNTSENGWQPGTATPGSTQATGMELINSRVHHNGTVAGPPPQNHGMYNNGRDMIVDGNEIYSNCGAGIHAYTATTGYDTINQNMIIRNNRVHHNGTCGQMHAIIFTAGSNIRVYNNIVHDNNGNGIVTYNTFPPNGAQVYNNVVYNNVGNGLYLFAGAATGTFWRNNISQSNGTNFYLEGGSATTSNNLCSTSIATLCMASTESATTTFNDPANANFTLKTGSVALDGGTPLSSPFNVSIDGTTRPQPGGGAFDIGAYETSTSAPSCPAVANALVASYGFEGNTTDSTGNGRTATLGSGWTYTGGKYGQGAVSTGASGITVADHDSLDPCGGFTYEAWVNLPDTTGPYALIVKNPDSKAFLLSAITYTCGDGRPLAGYSQDPVTAVACYGTAMATGSFQHLAVTYDSTLGSANVKLYLNGSPVTSASGTALLDATTGTLQFCTSGFGETCPSGTIIDEVRIYNYARSSGEITTDMNTPVGILAAPALTLSGTMKFGASATALKLP